MNPYDEVKYVTIIFVDGTHTGSGQIPHGDLLELIKAINGGKALIKLDERYGGLADRYIPVHRIAEIQVER